MMGALYWQVVVIGVALVTGSAQAYDACSKNITGNSAVLHMCQNDIANSVKKVYLDVFVPATTAATCSCQIKATSNTWLNIIFTQTSQNDCTGKFTVKKDTTVTNICSNGLTSLNKFGSDFLLKLEADMRTKVAHCIEVKTSSSVTFSVHCTSSVSTSQPTTQTTTSSTTMSTSSSTTTSTTMKPETSTTMSTSSTTATSTTMKPETSTTMSTSSTTATSTTMKPETSTTMSTSSTTATSTTMKPETPTTMSTNGTTTAISATMNSTGSTSISNTSLPLISNTSATMPDSSTMTSASNSSTMPASGNSSESTSADSTTATHMDTHTDTSTTEKSSTEQANSASLFSSGSKRDITITSGIAGVCGALIVVSLIAGAALGYTRRRREKLKRDIEVGPIYYNVDTDKQNSTEPPGIANNTAQSAKQASEMQSGEKVNPSRLSAVEYVTLDDGKVEAVPNKSVEAQESKPPDSLSGSRGNQEPEVKPERSWNMYSQPKMDEALTTDETSAEEPAADVNDVYAVVDKEKRSTKIGPYGDEYTLADKDSSDVEQTNTDLDAESTNMPREDDSNTEVENTNMPYEDDVNTEVENTNTPYEDDVNTEVENTNMPYEDDMKAEGENTNMSHEDDSDTEAENTNMPQGDEINTEVENTSMPYEDDTKTEEENTNMPHEDGANTEDENKKTPYEDESDTENENKNMPHEDDSDVEAENMNMPHDDDSNGAVRNTTMSEAGEFENTDIILVEKS